MRCYKCGYYSFDYLADCKKCSADLTTVRQELGLLDVEEDLPFTLEVLVEAGPSDAGKGLDAGPFAPGGQAAMESPADLEVLELSDADLELLDLADDELDRAEDAASKFAQAGSPGEDAEAESSLGGFLEMDLEEIDGGSRPTAPPSLEKAAEIAGDLEGDLSIDLSETDLSNILEDLQAIKDEEKVQPAALQTPAGPGAPTSDAADLRDEILFELSEENDNLFGSGKPKASNNETAKPEEHEIEFAFDDEDVSLGSAATALETDKSKDAEAVEEPHELTFDNIERELILDLLSTLDEAAKKQEKSEQPNEKDPSKARTSGRSSASKSGRGKGSGAPKTAKAPETSEDDSFVLDLSDDFSDDKGRKK